MSILQTQEMDVEVQPRGRVKRCRSCWRDDFHYNVKFSPVIFGFLLIVTCGLILFVRPSRCCCCGTMRVLY